MDDETKRAILNDILNRVGIDNIGQVVLEQNNTIQVGQPQPVQMPPHLTRERGMEIYRFLTDGGYIEAATPPEDFLYLMGVSSNAPLKLKPISWLRTMQQLRVMLTSAFEQPLTRGAIRLAELERRAPHCFLSQGKKLMTLPNARTEYSTELDQLVEFFGSTRVFSD